MAQERSQITQSVAFETARTLTSNTEQKATMREWRTTGAHDFKQKRADTILQSVAEMAGLPPADAIKRVQGQQKKETPVQTPKIAIGAARLNRNSSISSGSGAGAAASSNISRVPKFTPGKHLAENAYADVSSDREGKGKGKGKGGKGKGGKKGKGKPQEQSSQDQGVFAPQGPNYKGRRYDPNRKGGGGKKEATEGKGY